MQFAVLPLKVRSRTQAPHVVLFAQQEEAHELAGSGSEFAMTKFVSPGSFGHMFMLRRKMDEHCGKSASCALVASSAGGLGSVAFGTTSVKPDVTPASDAVPEQPFGCSQQQKQGADAHLQFTESYCALRTMFQAPQVPFRAQHAAAHVPIGSGSVFGTIKLVWPTALAHALVSVMKEDEQSRDTSDLVTP
jgi:hypothetical protein